MHQLRAFVGFFFGGEMAAHACLLAAALAAPGCRNEAAPREGRTELRDSAGRILAESFYRGGAPEGTWRTWFPGGVEKSRGSYRNGVAHGAWLSWHENGTLAFEGHYVDGRQFGLFRTWSEQGKLVSRVNFP